MKLQAYRDLFRQALFNGNGIARRLIVSLILFSTFITVIITYIELHQEYRNDVRDIHNSIDFIRQSTLPALTESIWVNDTGQIESQIRGLLNLRDIEYVAIQIEGKISWSAGQQVSSRTISEQVVMTRNYRGKQVTIGKLLVVASLDKVWQRLWHRLFAVSIDSAIKTLLVALFMMLVFQVLVTGHIIKLSNYARNLDPQHLDSEDLQLDRPATGHWRPDALDYLTQAFNDMRHKLRDAYDEMRKKNLSLIESEERLSMAMEATNDGVWDWSVKDERIHYSSGWAKMLDYEPDEIAPVFESWHSRIHPADRGSVLEQLDDHLYGSSPAFKIEHRLKRKQGDWLWVLGRGRTIERNADGKPIRVVGTITDISTLKAAEYQLQHLNEALEQRVAERTAELLTAREEAERASQAKSGFLSRMSHELRTPMNAILGFAQLLEMQKTPSLSVEQKDFVEEILRAGEHLLELINEILDLSRVESGHIEINSEAVAIAPLMNECLTLLTPLAKQQDIELQASIDPNCIALADPLRLNQVMLNLLSNAINFNKHGGCVSVEARHHAHQTVRISVTDTGIGIPPEDLSHLFQPFERLEQTRDITEGTGIGLVLSKLLVEAMQGQVGVDSQPGKGSTFWIILPATNTATALTSNTETLLPADTLTTGRMQKCLLYIEDNPANLKLIHKLVDALPHLKMLEATTAEQGLQIAIDQQPDLIFLDISLPGMDGYEALQHLRKNPATRKIPVVAVSANAMSHNIEQGLTAGFVAYITKPFDLSLIRQTLEQHLAENP